jgi:6-phosphogluconolactonase
MRACAGNPFPEKLFVLSSPEELSRAAAGRIWGIVRERVAALARAGKEAPRIRVALSGGETPRHALEILGQEPYRGSFPWEAVHFYQVDERWVPPGDALSNRRMLREALLSRAPVPSTSFHPVDTSRPRPEDGAKRYEEMLRDDFRVPVGGYPRFDAILLGIGKDGHTASLFPGAPDTAPPGSWVTAVTGGEPSLPRVTLTLPVLCAAARVIFLASGGEKAKALRAVLSGKPGLPASRVVPARGTVVFLADAQAASLAVRKRGGSR